MSRPIISADLAAGSEELDGALRLRLLWTHQPIFKTQTLPGTLITDAAGTAQTPVDRLACHASYVPEISTLDMLERYQSPFRQNPNQTWSTPFRDVRAYYQIDLNLSYDFTRRRTAADRLS